VKGHCTGRVSPLLRLASESNLLTQQREVRFVGQQTQHDLVVVGEQRQGLEGGGGGGGEEEEGVNS